MDLILITIFIIIIVILFYCLYRKIEHFNAQNVTSNTNSDGFSLNSLQLGLFIQQLKEFPDKMWDSSKSAIDSIGKKIDLYAASMKGDSDSGDTDHHDTITGINTEHYNFMQNIRQNQPDFYCIMVKLCQKILNKKSSDNIIVKCNDSITLNPNETDQVELLQDIINLMLVSKDKSWEVNQENYDQLSHNPVLNIIDAEQQTKNP